jgi:hypothetical protein
MYIIHGTQSNNAIKILKDGYIKINHENNIDGTYIKYNINQIFTQLLYRNIINENNQKPFWFNTCFIFKKEILKKYPFYAVGPIGSFYDNFDEGMKKDSNKIIYGKGNLKIMPKLQKLKDFINLKMKKNKTINDFIHSHEILFGNNLQLDDCIGIIYIQIVKDNREPYFENDKKLINNLKKLSKKYNLFVKIGQINYKNRFITGYGLNNFIDLIESK